jgi:threonylcarbamoyladenosine tRNA methylthiotransferase MtaB
MDHSLKYKVHTFGCKVNTYDSSLIGKNLARHGFQTSADNKSDVVKIHILNTCAVTAEATKEAVKLSRRLKAADPFCTVVVTGCAAQVDTGSFENLPGVDLVVANSHKSELPFILNQFYKGEIKEKIFKSNIFKKEDLEPGGGEEQHHTRAFLKIQDGCNSFCTYCVIPFARGKSRSLSVQHLAQRINQFHQQGVNEVVLTGVHIGDYEDETGKKLEDLLEAVLHKTSIPRIRLTSLEPVEVTDRLLDLYEKNERLCPHFHMSIQSANTDVLKDMKRHYTADDVERSLNEIHRRLPHAFVGMDVIVGFPTETQEKFDDTYLRLANLPWTRIHVFPYSERPGTYAARLENLVSDKELHLRALRLRELSIARYQERASLQTGQTKKILVLKSKKGMMQGLSRDYWNIEFTGNKELMVGSEIEAKIISSQAPTVKMMEAPLLAEVTL